MSAPPATEYSGDGVEIVDRTLNPAVSQQYGGRERRYRVIGGVRVEDVNGRVWFECQFCDFTAELAHAIPVHRGWKHPARMTTRQVDTGSDRRTDDRAVLHRVARLISIVHQQERDIDEWRGRALNAEAAARALREGGRP